MQDHFFTAPPGWMLCLLWLSFAYVGFRTVIWGLLHTKQVRALILARLHRIPVSSIDIVTVSIQRIDPVPLVKACVTLQAAGLPVSFADLAALQRSGGNVEVLAGAALLARRLGISCSLDELYENQKSGNDPMEYVRSRANGIR